MFDEEHDPDVIYLANVGTTAITLIFAIIIYSFL